MKLEVHRPFHTPHLPHTPRRFAERPDTGARGEDIAVEYLRRAGHAIIARNWTVRDGEVDVITLAPERDRLVFVEVRTRWRGSATAPQTSVTRPKQRRLVTLARIFLARHAARFGTSMVTFDVIGVWLPDEELVHVPCAFEAP